MRAGTLADHPPAATERRSLPPSRIPDQGIRSGNTPREGPPLPPSGEPGPGLYWIVLHCRFEPDSRDENEH
jgi:hypothetical protein